MNTLPGAFRAILNIFFYAIYSIICIFASGFVFPLLGINLSATDSNAMKITLIIAIMVLFITFIFRKFFYISLSSSEN